MLVLKPRGLHRLQTAAERAVHPSVGQRHLGARVRSVDLRKWEEECWWGSNIHPQIPLCTPHSPDALFLRPHFSVETTTCSRSTSEDECRRESILVIQLSNSCPTPYIRRNTTSHPPVVPPRYQHTRSVSIQVCNSHHRKPPCALDWASCSNSTASRDPHALA